MNDYLQEFLSLSACFGLFWGYWFWISGRVYHLHPQSFPALNRDIRESWLRAFEVDAIESIVAVQSIRNNIMSSTMLASSCFLLLTGLISLLAHVDTMAAFAQKNISWIVLPPGMLLFKLGFLIVLQLACGFCFITAIRYQAHASFIACLPKQYRGESERVALSLYLRQAGVFYSIGQRLVWFGVPILAWFVNDTALWVSAMFVLFGMFLIDSVWLSKKLD